MRLGRRVARSGAVGTAHRTDVLVQQFWQAEWDRLLGLAAAEPGHITALLAARHRGLRPLAWGFGAAPGPAALEDDWTPDRTALTRARTALSAAWAEEEAPVLRRVRARWTSPGDGAADPAGPGGALVAVPPRGRAVGPAGPGPGVGPGGRRPGGLMRGGLPRRAVPVAREPAGAGPRPGRRTACRGAAARRRWGRSGYRGTTGG
ncbi:hypothetical protein ACIRS3_14770 [Streptomyces virginiae]|uniref:hypothetical protein n=1 Tax=Streptomyces virginiae TaxID=1961 RepID=UPI0037F17333